MVKWSSRRLVTKRLSGMVVFASLRVGDALMAAEAMRKARSKVARERVRRACGLVDPSLREAGEEAPRDPTPKEEALMGAFRQEFSTSLRIRHALLHSFSENQCDKGDDTALPPCVRLFRPRCAGMDEESGDWGSYVIDLDCVYTDDINLLSELHSRWIMLTRRLLEDTCEAPPLHPEIIVIVLCTSEVTPRVSYGSLLPSVVRIAQTSNTEELRIAQWNVRVRGFPPSLKFCIPLDVLNQLSAWNGEYKAMSALDADCDWFVSQSKACSASGKWCTVRLVTSEFLKHSLFFLEWCVPEDFSFVPRCLALREEKPTTDVLARLLLDSYVSMHLEHFSRRRKSHDRPHLTVDNVRGGTKENEGGHGKPTLSAHGDTPKRVGVVHKANSPLANIHNQSSLHNPTEKPTTGIGWVSPDGMRGRSSYGAKHGGHGETCQVQRAAGHVKMAREMCSIGLLVQRYGGVVSSLFSSSGINNKERIQQEHIAVTKSGESSSILLRQLNVFQRNYHNGCRTVEAKMEAANCILRDKVPVLETLRRQYVSATATATSTVNGEAARRRVSFLFTRDGDKLLRAPLITSGSPHNEQRNVTELADVAEIKYAFEANLRAEGGAGCNDVFTSLPHGRLKSLLMTTITSYLSVRRSDDPVVSEQVGSGGDGCQARSLLEVLGKVLSRCFSIASGTGSGELETVSTEALRKLISAKGFWGAVLDEMSRALLDCDEYRLKGACMSCHGSLRTIPQESCVLKALQGELKRAAFSPTPPGEGTRGERWLKHIAFLLGHASLCGHSAKPVVRHPKTRLSEGDVDVLARDRAWRIVQGLRGHISSLDAATCASKMCFSKWLQDEQKRLARKRSSGLQ